MKLVIKGVVKQTSTWIVIAEAKIEITVTAAECEQAAQEIRDLIAHSFKSVSGGFIALSDVVIDIQSFAVLSVEVQE